MATARFPAYPRRLDPRGRLRIRINSNGSARDYYLPKPLGSPESIAEYERLRLEHAQGKLAKPAPPVAGMTISELITAWLLAEPRGFDDREVVAICRACTPLDRVYGSTPAADFSAGALETLRDAMISREWMTDADRKGNRDRDWSRGYINMAIMRVCRVFRWGETKGHVPRGTWQHLRTLAPLKKSDKRVRSTLPRLPVDFEAQVKPCLPFMAPVIAALVQVQFFGGMRPDEVCMMRRNEVDKAGPHGTWIYRPADHKNAHRGQDLAKVLGPLAQAVLAPWLLACEPDGFVFPPVMDRYRRGHYMVEGYGRAISRACVAAGVKPWHAYQLRHAAKLRVTRSHGLDAARAHLGQASLGATAGYAAQQDLETAAKVAAAVG